MKRKIFSALCAFLLTVPAMHAQWVVTDPGNLAQGIVNSVNEMVETSETAQNAMSTFKEASKIYEQSRKYYDMLKSENSLVSGSLKVEGEGYLFGIPNLCVLTHLFFKLEHTVRSSEVTRRCPVDAAPDTVSDLYGMAGRFFHNLYY